MKYKVNVKLECYYEVEADTEEYAREIALNYFDECNPEVEIEKSEEE